MKSALFFYQDMQETVRFSWPDIKLLLKATTLIKKKSRRLLLRLKETFPMCHHGLNPVEFFFLLVTDVLHTLTYITYKIANFTHIAKVTYNLVSLTRLTIYTLFTIYLTLFSCRGLATIGGFLTY